MDEIRSLIIKKLVELMPKSIKLVDYLSDTLCISKNSAYRRLQGKMSFSFEELATLSRKMHFSLDELAALDPDDNKVIIDLKIENCPENTFLRKIKEYKKDLENQLSDKSSSTMIVLNHLPAELCVCHGNLFKLSYYLWLHWEDKGKLKPKFSEIKIPPKLESLRKSVAAYSEKTGNRAFILDPNVFLTPVKLILYFHKMELIDDEEKKAIKEELLDVIDSLENKIRKEIGQQKIKEYIYLSGFNVDFNSIYCTYDNKEYSYFLLYFFNRIVVTKPEICKAHKGWLQSLQKYSTLISESNEALQAAYLKKQREHIGQL
jgi:hypothetical protein